MVACENVTCGRVVRKCGLAMDLGEMNRYYGKNQGKDTFDSRY